MKKISIYFLLVYSMVAGSAWAMECPFPISENPQGDHDGDGILNDVDPCCFVTSLREDMSEELCPEESGQMDQNGNGQPMEEEGYCCVSYTNDSTGAETEHAWCGPAREGNTDVPFCGVDDTNEPIPPVKCDTLLLYDEMALHFGGDVVNLFCGSMGCICYTIGDYDGDDDEWNPDEPSPGPFDNCPTIENDELNADFTQINTDGDLWGDACDWCPEDEDEPYWFPEGLPDPAGGIWLGLQCSIEDNDCPGDGICVPMIVPNNAFPQGDASMYIQIGNFCSESPDKDNDDVGDICDNCVDKPNEDQSDIDSDGMGDLCDACPTEAIEITSEWENSDTDHIVDECDNCPAEYNPLQEDYDKDGDGDHCDPCPYDMDITGEDDLPDLDQDGYPDVCDPCPSKFDITGEDPEWMSMYPDKDQDGYADECDNCPDVANSQQEDEDDDGHGDACPFVQDTESETEAVSSFSGGGLISCAVSSPGMSRSTILSLIF